MNLGQINELDYYRRENKPKKSLEKNINKTETKEEDDLLEFFDEGDPKFLEQRKKIVLGIRRDLESIKPGQHKRNPEEIFINSDVFSLAQENGIDETFKVLKDEFLHLLKSDNLLEDKINISLIVGDDLKSNRSRNLKINKEKIVKNFEDSIKLSFLTEASSCLLKNSPEVRVIDYTTELKKGFEGLVKDNNKVILNKFFSEKSVDVGQGDKINIRKDRIIMNDIDFKKGEVHFESEKHKIAIKEINRMIEDEKLLSIKELEDAIVFLEKESADFSEPGFFFNDKKKKAREKLKEKIVQTKQLLESSLIKLKREGDKIGNYDYHNEFLELFNSFKSKVDLVARDFGESDREKYKSIVKKFEESLLDLKNFGADLHDCSNFKFNLNRSFLNSGRGKLSFPAEINNLSSFNEFDSIIKLGFLQKPFTYENFNLAINRFSKRFGQILDAFDSSSLAKFEYFNHLKKEFSSFCAERGVSNEIRREMMSRFF